MKESCKMLLRAEMSTVIWVRCPMRKERVMGDLCQSAKVFAGKTGKRDEYRWENPFPFPPISLHSENCPRNAALSPSAHVALGSTSFSPLGNIKCLLLKWKKLFRPQLQSSWYLPVLQWGLQAQHRAARRADVLCRMPGLGGTPETALCLAAEHPHAGQQLGPPEPSPGTGLCVTRLKHKCAAADGGISYSRKL